MSRSDQRCPTGKICFSTRQFAKRAAKRLLNAKFGRMTSYLCGICDYYHIGHAPAYEREWQRERNRGLRA